MTDQLLREEHLAGEHDEEPEHFSREGCWPCYRLVGRRIDLRIVQEQTRKPRWLDNLAKDLTGQITGRS